MPTVEVLLQLKLSAFTCRTDETVSKQCDSDALIHPPDRRNKALSVSECAEIHALTGTCGHMASAARSGPAGGAENLGYRSTEVGTYNTIIGCSS